MAFDRVESEQSVADRLNEELRDAAPLEILRRAHEIYGDKLALVSSFGAESAVLLHLAAQVDPGIAVLFLDTGMLFGQTLDYRKTLAAKLGLTGIRDLRPTFADLATQDPKSDLWRTSVDACCNIRKVIPLDNALKDYAAWITGRKRFQGGDRLRLRVVEEGDNGQIKFNPLANWSREQIEAYTVENEIPAHPLVAQGFPSIGCWPCTKPVEKGADPRSGRWAGQEKTECGIHVARSSITPSNVGGDI
jgi:phosphoadenosine phosphosulfate reductase